MDLGSEWLRTNSPVKQAEYVANILFMVGIIQFQCPVLHCLVVLIDWAIISRTLKQNCDKFVTDKHFLVKFSRVQKDFLL